MEPVTALLGYAVGKAVFKAWFKDSEFLASASESAVEIVHKVIGDRRARSAAERHIQRISEKSADIMEPLIEAEWNSLPVYEKNAAIICVQEAVDATCINASTMSRIDYDVEKLAGLIMSNCDTSALNEEAKSLANALSSEASQLIVDLASSMPEFHRESFSEILRRESQIMDRLDRVFDEVQKIRESTISSSLDAAFAHFEEVYRRAVARTLDQIELFGLGAATRQTSRQHSLSTAYISLTVSESSKHSDEQSIDVDLDDQDNQSLFSMTAEEAAAWSRLIVIKGEAGSGKTTLLQSLAVRSATAGFDESMIEWNNLIPFFIRLRALSESGLPPPEEFPRLLSPNIAGLMPSGWVHRQLDAGRGVLLIDGLDEVSSDRREATRKWITDLLATYSDLRIVVTSRPPAIPDGWLASKGFRELELLPMSPDDVSTFIDHWHEAVAAEEQLLPRREAVLQLIPGLRERIKGDRDLKELASTPLLCAMLCAMNRDRKQVLPSNRLALYEAATQMVLHGRDEERKVRIDELPRLEFETKKSILQEVAFWMMQNGLSMADIWRVEEFVSGILPRYTRLHENVSSSSVVSSLILRSGILRSPVEGKVDFIHNAFKEYLCAKAVVSDDRFGFVKTVLSNEAWREVASLATALADAKRRSEFIRELLKEGDTTPQKRARFHLLAVRCLETCTELEPNLQSEIRERLSGLSPPDTITEAKALSAAGDMALPLLRTTRGQYARTAAACVRGLRLVGTPDALTEMEQFAADERATIAREVISAWPFFDNAEFSRRILSKSRGVYGAMRLTHHDQLEAVKYLKNIIGLTVSIRKREIDIKREAEIFDLTNLHRLNISADGDFDCEKVTRLHRLYSLIVAFSTISNINAIGRLENLERFNVSGRPDSKLSVESLPRELSELVIRGGKIDVVGRKPPFDYLDRLGLTGIGPQSNLSWITELSDINQLEIRKDVYEGELSLISNPSSLQSLTMLGFRGLKNLGDLLNPVNLRKLTIQGASDLEDLERIVEAKNLQHIDLRGSTNIKSFEFLKGLSRLQHIVVQANSFTDLSFLEELPALSSARIIGPTVEQTRELSYAINSSPSLRHASITFQVVS